MKKFLVLFLIYSLNIIVFLFAKSAGAAVVFDKISDLRTENGRVAFTLQGHKETIHVNGRSPAIECLKKANSMGSTAGIELDDMSGNLKGCKLVVSRLPGGQRRY
jgi:hypothetical protein